MRVVHLVVLGALLGVPAGLRGQSDVERPAIGYVGISAQVAQPVHELAKYLGIGVGVDASYTVPVLHVPSVALRADLGLLRWGDQSRGICLFYFAYTLPVGSPSCATATDLVTSGTIVQGGMGPQVSFRAGPIQPYALGELQIRSFWTSSTLQRADNGAVASAYRFHDTAWTWSIGGGVTAPLPFISGMHIDVGVLRYSDGSGRYLRRDDIAFQPPGYVVPPPHPQSDTLPRVVDIGGGASVVLQTSPQSAADLLIYHLGVTVPIR